MSQCVIDFDTCHQICFPEEHLTGGPGPATLPAAPETGAPENEDGDGPKKHKDVTDLGATDDDSDDNDVDDEEGDQDEIGMAVGVAVGSGETKVLYGKGKGHSRVKAAAKEAVALTLTPEEINRLQQSYTDEYDESIIDAPAGGEDAAEFDDDPSDY